MNIKQIYPKLKISNDIYGITNNSKNVKNNYIFVAINGTNYNGNDYINEAFANGACLVITEKNIRGNKRILRVKNAKNEYIKLLKLFYHYNHDIYTVGITGTDGKTTTTAILNNIFNQINPSASIGTNGIIYVGRIIKTKYTTPTPEMLYQAYNVFKKHKINNLTMEVSSEGIIDNRIYGFKFDGAIFTNLTHEHLNTHKSMYNYFKAKAKLFEKLSPAGLAVINYDDPFSRFISFHTKAKIITYGINGGTYQARNIRLSYLSSSFDVYYKGHLLKHFNLPLFGKYNIYNALAAIAYTYELGINKEIIKQGIESLAPINGRFMHYTSPNNIHAIIDFAHTPNALKNILSNLNEFKKGKIITIIGAQGEKDKSKRKIMGEIACDNSDITIFTSEDPKNENLFGIFADLTQNLKDKEYYLTLTRKEAIILASRLAKCDDIILVTGKGNESFEQVLNYRFKHNDLTTIKRALTDN